MIAKRSWMNSSKFINSQIRKLRSKSCTPSMTSGTERTTMSSEISKRLNLICWSFTAILSRSGLQFTLPIWSNPLTTLSSVKLSLKQSFQLNSRYWHSGNELQRTLFQSNPQRLWSGSGYLRIVLWLNKRLKNQSTRKIYLHKKFDGFKFLVICCNHII